MLLSALIPEMEVMYNANNFAVDISKKVLISGGSLNMKIEHQNAHVQVILHMHKVSSGPLLSIQTFCSRRVSQ